MVVLQKLPIFAVPCNPVDKHAKICTIFEIKYRLIELNQRQKLLK